MARTRRTSPRRSCTRLERCALVGNAVRGIPTRAVVGSNLGSFELCKEVARTGQPVAMSSDRNSLPPELTAHSSHELYGVPLKYEEELLGIAYAGSSEHEALTERERSLFSTVAERAAWAVAKHAERSRLQAERSDLLRREQVARQEAELANRAKDEFLATLSHELRTPLNAVLGWTARARAKAPPELERALDIVARNAEAQARMVDDMLDLSRITAGTMRLDLAPLQVRDSIFAALEAVRPAAEAKGVELASEVDEALRVDGDADRLQQIVANLLSNAIKFTPANGRVTVRVHAEDGKVLIQVTDTGQGIAEEFLPSVFTAFRQADGSSTRRHGGLGLGLAIARELAEAHAGGLYAASDGEGKGSRFTLELPVLPADGPLRADEQTDASSRAFPPTSTPNAASRTAEAPSSIPRLAHVKVLVVDDEADSRALISELFADIGAEVRTADSAAAALTEV